MIELRILGPVSVRRADGGTVTSLLAQLTPVAVAAFLAAPVPEGGRGRHREDALLSMFWPEWEPARARAALRETLSLLREALGTTALVMEGDLVGLDAAAVWCDLDAFDAAIRQGDWAAAFELHCAPLPGGLPVADAAPFTAWLDAQRQRRRAALRDALLLAVRRLAAAGLAEDALAWARRVRALDPQHEESALEGPSGIAPLPTRLPGELVAGSPRGMRVYGRPILEAVLPSRLAQARRRGQRLPLLTVALSVPPGGAPPDAEAGEAFEAAVMHAIRGADLAGRLAPRAVLVLPEDDGSLDMDAFATRLGARLRDGVWGAARVSAHRIDPNVTRTAGDVLADLMPEW